MENGSFKSIILYFLSVSELLEVPSVNFVTLDANTFDYYDHDIYLILYLVHPFFLKAKADASKVDH